jgi:hypothetical protein
MLKSLICKTELFSFGTCARGDEVWVAGSWWMFGGDLYAGFVWNGLSEQVYFSCKFSKTTDNLFFIKKQLFPI